MAEKKTIAVVGATGAQGGGLARAILDDPHGEFACRALTRDTTSEAARALADRGAEVAAADLDDEDSLAAAFEGAHGAYCMTNFFEHFSAEKETGQAGNLARAAKTAGARHAIWSTSRDSQEWVSPTGDTHNRLSLEAVRAAPYPGADAVANMFQIIAETNGDYCAQYEPDLSRSLNPRLQTLAGWLAGSRRAVPAPAGAR